MRIIAGTFKSRLLVFPKVRSIRPTMDRVRESIFNIIGTEVKGATVLDLCAGSGSLGFEALSRGARSVVFVDTHHAAIAAITTNASRLEVKTEVEIIRDDAVTVLEHDRFRTAHFDLIFADPPYGVELAKKILLNVHQFDILAPTGLAVIEHAAHDDLPLMTSIKPFKIKEFGETKVTFFCRA